MSDRKLTTSRSKSTPAQRWAALLHACSLSYDSVAAARPGPCGKCKGTGTFRWKEHGQAQAGRCFACDGSGQLANADIFRNRAYAKGQFNRQMQVLEIVADHVSKEQINAIMARMVTEVSGFKDFAVAAIADVDATGSVTLQH
jgi:DnaJ-class molecular chaperone